MNEDIILTVSFHITLKCAQKANIPLYRHSRSI